MKSKTINYIITSAEVDYGKNYKPFSFMCDAQEVANIHASSINFGYDDLIKKNCVWVLSRMKVKYLQSPRWGDNVNLSTWHKGRDGVFYIRDFEMRNASDGTPLIMATSSWLIIDIESRKMLRTDHIISDSNSVTMLDRDAVAEHCCRLRTPEDMSFAMTKEIRYSDIDFNGHANNAKYIEWAFDCIDPKLLINSEIDEYQINFNHEARLGDKIQMTCSKIDNGSIFIEGENNDTIIFQTKINLKPKSNRGLSSL